MKPAKHGMAWSEEDVATLIDGFNRRVSPGHLARSLERTINGTLGKLRELGLVIAWGRGYRRVEADEWISFEEVRSLEVD